MNAAWANVDGLRDESAYSVMIPNGLGKKRVCVEKTWPRLGRAGPDFIFIIFCWTLVHAYVYISKWSVSRFVGQSNPHAR